MRTCQRIMLDDSCAIPDLAQRHSTWADTRMALIGRHNRHVIVRPSSYALLYVVLVILSALIVLMRIGGRSSTGFSSNEEKLRNFDRYSPRVASELREIAYFPNYTTWMTSKRTRNATMNMYENVCLRFHRDSEAFDVVRFNPRKSNRFSELQCQRKPPHIRCRLSLLNSFDKKYLLVPWIHTPSVVASVSSPKKLNRLLFEAPTIYAARYAFRELRDENRFIWWQHDALSSPTGNYSLPSPLTEDIAEKKTTAMFFRSKAQRYATVCFDKVVVGLCSGYQYWAKRCTVNLREYHRFISEREILGPGGIEMGGTYVLYITSNNEFLQTKRILNEEELVRNLSAVTNITVVSLETASHQELVSLIRGAAGLITTHGEAERYAIYLEIGSFFLELRPFGSFSSDLRYFFNGICHLKYHQIRSNFRRDQYKWRFDIVSLLMEKLLSDKSFSEKTMMDLCERYGQSMGLSSLGPDFCSNMIMSPSLDIDIPSVVAEVSRFLEGEKMAANVRTQEFETTRAV